MRKMKKFAKGGGAEAKRDRRMEDIASDYNKAIARGMSEKEARAKRAQREADARDDYAKRTGADRTETRAAEKAAEQRLTASRRSQDKNILSVGVASEGPSRKPVDTTPAKVSTPKDGGSQSFSQAFAAARKDGAKTFTWKGKPYTTETRGEKKPAPPKTTATPPKTTATPSTAAAFPNKLPPPARETLYGLPAVAERRRLAERAKDPPPSSRAKAAEELRRLSGAKFAKGGSVDGIAIRGKTKLKRKK